MQEAAFGWVEIITPARRAPSSAQGNFMKNHLRALKASLEEIQITSIHHFLPAFRPKEMVKGMLVTWISSFLLPLPKTKIV